MDTRDDAELLTEFSAKGSHAAFAALVSRHGPMAHGIATRVLSSHHDAQDVTQAVFILLARDARKLASSPSVAGWIHTVTRRLALNAHKSRGRRQRREHTAMEHTTTTTPLNPAQDAPFRRELDAAIARLPERYRQPLLLVHLEGAPMDEVAKRLALHPDTLRTRLSRARGKLRELLGQRGVEIASVTVLSSFLTNELKASSAFSPELASTVLDGAIGGASVSPHVLELTAKGAVSTSISLSAITLIMKTKASIIIAIVVTLVAIGGATLQLSKRGDSTTTTAAAMPALGSPASSQSRNARETSAKDPLAGLSENKIRLLLKQISLLADDERLKRLRKDLGMDISDEAYRKAIADYGYQINTDALFFELVKQWNSEDPRAATLWLKHMETFDWIKIYDSLLAWLIKDKAAATAWAEENNVNLILVDALGKHDSIKLNGTPLSSAEFTRRLGDMSKSLDAITGSDETALDARDEQRSEMMSLVRDWSGKDPAAAMKFFAENLEKFGNWGTWHPKPMIERWAHLDPDAALRWAKETKDEKLRAYSLVSILPSWQLKYPDKSISDVADLSVIPDDEYEALINTVVKNWVAVNPSAAMEFAMSAKESKLQKEIVTDVIKVWTLKSPVEARQWIEDAPAGDLRDSAIVGYIKTGDVTDVGDTGKLLREIGNPDMRQEAISDFVFYSDAIAKDLPKTLELAREVPKYLSLEFIRWTSKVNLGDLPAYRTWLDQAAAEGRIVYDFTKSFDEYEPAIADQKRREYNAAQHKELLRRIEKSVKQR